MSKNELYNERMLRQNDLTEAGLKPELPKTTFTLSELPHLTWGLTSRGHNQQ